MDTDNSNNDLAELWSIGGKHHRAQASAGFRFCPQCGGQLTGKFSTCPRCGADLRNKNCPFCGGLVPIDAAKCPRCTAPLITSKKDL